MCPSEIPLKSLRAGEHEKPQSQIAAIFCRKLPGRQPSSNGVASLIPLSLIFWSKPRISAPNPKSRKRKGRTPPKSKDKNRRRKKARKSKKARKGGSRFFLLKYRKQNRNRRRFSVARENHKGKSGGGGREKTLLEPQQIAAIFAPASRQSQSQRSRDTFPDPPLLALFFFSISLLLLFSDFLCCFFVRFSFLYISKYFKRSAKRKKKPLLFLWVFLAGLVHSSAGRSLCSRSFELSNVREVNQEKQDVHACQSIC